MITSGKILAICWNTENFRENRHVLCPMRLFHFIPFELKSEFCSTLFGSCFCLNWLKRCEWTAKNAYNFVWEVTENKEKHGKIFLFHKIRHSWWFCCWNTPLRTKIYQLDCALNFFLQLVLMPNQTPFDKWFILLSRAFYDSITVFCLSHQFDKVSLKLAQTVWISFTKSVSLRILEDFWWFSLLIEIYGSERYFEVFLRNIKFNRFHLYFGNHSRFNAKNQWKFFSWAIWVRNFLNMKILFFSSQF